MRVLKYVKLRQHNFAEILLKKRVCEDKSRSVYPDNGASVFLETSESSKFCLFNWVFVDEKIFCMQIFKLFACKFQDEEKIASVDADWREKCVSNVL